MYAETLFAHGEPGVPGQILVISPKLGVFHLLPRQVFTLEGEIIEEGTTIGTVAGQEVRTFRAGRLVKILVLEGERVKPKQPLAYLQAV